jgi:hypothetical protein
MENIWTQTMKPIPGFTGYYCDENSVFISTRKKKTGRKLKPSKHHSGYYVLGLHKDGIFKQYTIHRLVALTHLENPNDLPLVDHIDRNKSNNKKNNLRWVTYSENALNASKNKTYDTIEFTEEDIKGEIWKNTNILNEYGVYNLEVSSLGKLKYKSKTGRDIMVTPKDKQDYNSIGFRSEDKSVPRFRTLLHVFVWKVFNGDYDNKKYVINHKNGNKSDCRLSNLELCTFSENTKHAHDNGMICVYRVMTKELGKDIISDFYEHNISPYQITMKYGKSSNDIWDLLKGEHNYYEYDDEEIDLCKTFKDKQRKIISDTNKKSSVTKIRDINIFKKMVELSKQGMSVRKIANEIGILKSAAVHKYITNDFQRLREEYPKLFI